MKKLFFLKTVRPIFFFVGSFFFDAKYLRGKHFDESLVGWKWVFRSIFTQKIFRINSHVPWPVSMHIAIDEPLNIYFDNNDLNNFQTFGCYFSNSNKGKIVIGKGTWIAPNVGIITTNHDFKDLIIQQPPQDINIGNNCWIGMNSTILPGVVLGDCTIVGAGSVVTKSFPNGNVVIAGNPAKVLKDLEL